MADTVTSTAGTAGSAGGGAASSLGAGGLGGMVGNLGTTITSTLSGLPDKVKGMFNQFMPPERREQLWEKVQKFATERPKFAAFIFSHIALSGAPLALFILMTFLAGLIALVAGLLVGVIGILLFILSAVGFALVFLFPTLLITTTIATFLFLFGVGGYYIIKWFNEKKIPGIHVPFSDGVKEVLSDSGLSQLPALNPGASKAGSGSSSSGGSGGDSQGEKKSHGAGENGSAHSGDQKQQSSQGRTTQSQPQSQQHGGANKAEKRQPHAYNQDQSQDGQSKESQKKSNNDAGHSAPKSGQIPKLDK